MKTQSCASFITCLLLLASFFSSGRSASSPPGENFLRCLVLQSNDFASISQVTFFPSNSSYASVLGSRINNPIFNTSSTPRPSVIVAPTDELQVQTVIRCCREHGLQMRIRGGGHDFEAVSSTAPVPFIMLDLNNMKAVDIDVKSKTAWVQGGASLGEFYYRISEKSKTLGFPAGVWSTVGVGGIISGGGYGNLMRKYGLAVDNVVDARLMDAKGRILDRKSMGEDLFWAIRGGGGSSFGVILAWKVSLVNIPETWTVFTISKSLEENATYLFHKWKTAAPSIDRDLLIRVQLQSEYVGTTGGKTLRISFEGIFQGRIDRLLPIMQVSFPELGVTRESCTEMSWIQTVLVFSGFSSQTPTQTLLDRSAAAEFAVKGKSDYVQEPIPIKGLEGLWRMLLKNDVGTLFFVLNPLGGRMAEIPESAVPFPHRAGNLYQLLEAVILDVQRPEVTRRRIQWIRSFYSYIGRYVSKSPRQAYVNYNDFDLGVSTKSYREASVWGRKYFKNNFKRLVRVKRKADPENFFNHPQSIPLLRSLQ